MAWTLTKIHPKFKTSMDFGFRSLQSQLLGSFRCTKSKVGGGSPQNPLGQLTALTHQNLLPAFHGPHHGTEREGDGMKVEKKGEEEEL